MTRFDPLLAWTETHGTTAWEQGWGLFEPIGPNHWPIELQADDELMVFERDLDAWHYVVRSAAAGDVACASALHLLHAESRGEWSTIITSKETP